MTIFLPGANADVWVRGGLGASRWNVTRGPVRSGRCDGWTGCNSVRY